MSALKKRTKLRQQSTKRQALYRAKMKDAGLVPLSAKILTLSHYRLHQLSKVMSDKKMTLRETLTLIVTNYLDINSKCPEIHIEGDLIGFKDIRENVHLDVRNKLSEFGFKNKNRALDAAINSAYIIHCESLDHAS